MNQQTLFQQYKDSLNYTDKNGHEKFINNLITSYRYAQSTSQKYIHFEDDIKIMTAIKKLFTEPIEDEKEVKKRIKKIFKTKGSNWVFLTIRTVMIEYLRKAYFDKIDFDKIEDDLTHIDEIKNVLRTYLQIYKTQ